MIQYVKGGCKGRARRGTDPGQPRMPGRSPTAQYEKVDMVVSEELRMHKLNLYSDGIFKRSPRRKNALFFSGIMVKNNNSSLQ